jgi:predicted ATPase/transcriptional regulator with XRE-family HTH domain
MPAHRGYRDRNYSFANQVLTFRTRMGLTQAQLAALVGVHRRSVQNWESGVSYPKAEALRRLLSALLEGGAFTAGEERAEARALWEHAAQEGQAPAGFDEAWFSSALASRAGAGARSDGPGPAPLIGLPPQPTAFIGRADELAAIGRLLDTPACRLVTLLGPGGIGKSRLAIEAAAAFAHRFPDGAAFVGLAPVGAPGEIALAIGDVLGVSFAGQREPSAQLLDALRGRHMLLVLDNFEHLLDGAELVAAILAQAPLARLIVTSRERLDLRAEWIFDVDGLTYPPYELIAHGAPTLAGELSGYSAVELFVQRAAQVHSGAAPPEATLTMIGRICQQVAGMPLAIELAAAGARTLPVAEIERRIRTNLDALTTTLRDVPARHRSLRAVFDHSWSLLNEAERALFSRLTVFRGGWTAEAAAQVAGANLMALANLVGKSLVRQLGAAGASAEGATRYTLLEPLREYALERLAARGELEAMREAHARYYLGVAEAAAAQWDTPTVDAAIGLLEREHDNMRAALRWAREGGRVAVGLSLAAALWRFWRGNGAINEGRAWLAELLARPGDGDAAAAAARLRALRGAAWLASDQHEFALAAQLFEQSMALRRDLGEQVDETQPLLNAARQARAAGEYRRATTLLEEALARHRAQGDRGSSGNAGMGLSLYELALVRRERGDFALARALYEECVAFHRAIGDREGEIAALLGLGDVARDQGDIEATRRYTEQSLAVFRELGIQWAIGFAVNNLAIAACLAGELHSAAALVAESVALFRALKDDSGLAEVLLTQAMVATARGDQATAHAALMEALRRARAVGPQVLVAAAFEGLAALAAEREHHEAAARMLAVAAALRTELGAPVRPIDRPALERATTTTSKRLGAQALAAARAVAEQPRERSLAALTVAASGILSPRGRAQRPT